MDGERSDFPAAHFDADVDLARLAALELEMDHLEQAVAWVDDDGSGVCGVCGELIPRERPGALPATGFCPGHVGGH